MDYRINRQLGFISLIVLALFLAGCTGGDGIAPVVEAGHTSAARHDRYIVRAGDTLYSVAWAFGKDYRYLARINNLSYPYALRVGQPVYLTAWSARHYGSIRPQPTYKPVKKRWQPQRTKARTAYRRPLRPLVEPRNIAVRHWLWPAKGKLISRFSWKGVGNKGIDISGRYGEPVRASASGLIVYSGTGLRAYGKLIIIKHNANYLSAYAHNRRMLVKEGQFVKAGQKIAAMGRKNSGKIVLHFEIRRNGHPVDPLRYLRRR